MENEELAGNAEAQPRSPDSLFLIPDSLNLIPDSKPPSLRDAPPGDAKKKKSNAVPLIQWLQEVKAAGEKPISGYEKLWVYADQVGLSHDWIKIAWIKFSERYKEDPAYKDKQYVDWRYVFMKYIKNGWLKLWYRKDDCYFLTTAGQQAEIETREVV